MKAFAIGSVLLVLTSTAFYVFGKRGEDYWRFFMAASVVFALLAIAAAIVQEAQ